MGMTADEFVRSDPIRALPLGDQTAAGRTLDLFKVTELVACDQA